MFKPKLFFAVCLLALAAGCFLSARGVTAAPPAQLTPYPTPTAGVDGLIIHIVRENESLWVIAAIYNIPLEKIYELNNWEKDHVINPGDKVILAVIGPAATPTPGPAPTETPAAPTIPPPPGWGILCVILYEDVNGDSVRQEEESVLTGGAISVSSRTGEVSITAESQRTDALSACNETLDAGGFVIFDQLPEGDYNISVAAPDGYNPTTVMNKPIQMEAGRVSYVSFGAQANSETEAEIPIIPTETPGRSPLLGILGGVILLSGVGLGVYAALLRRPK
jgi:hypothetical protein